MIAPVRVPALRPDWLRAAIAEPTGFLWGTLVNVLTTAVSLVWAPHAHLAHLLVLYLLGPVLISTRFGIVVCTFTVITSALSFNYFCIPPTFAFAIPDTDGLVTFVGMLFMAMLVCLLNVRLRYQRTLARASEARTAILCELSLDLSEITSVAELPSVAQPHIKRLFGPKAMVHLQPSIKVTLDGLDRPTVEQQLLVDTCVDRMSAAVERLSLQAAARKAAVDAEAERMRSALLSSVSHDLKTPLSSILTAGTALLTQPGQTTTQHELLVTIVEESERLNALLTNLLSVTRLETGTIRLNKRLDALDDLLLSVLSRLSGRLGDRKIDLNIPQDLPLIPIDPTLIDQLLVNLLENILRYTPAGSPIQIGMSTVEQKMVLSIRDQGPGIPEGERERVFEKFYRGKGTSTLDGGTGLGLTICRAVAAAHQGSIAISSPQGGGTLVELVLPLAGSDHPSVRPASQREERSWQS